MTNKEAPLFEPPTYLRKQLGSPFVGSHSDKVLTILEMRVSPVLNFSKMGMYVSFAHDIPYQWHAGLYQEGLDAFTKYNENPILLINWLRSLGVAYFKYFEELSISLDLSQLVPKSAVS